MPDKMKFLSTKLKMPSPRKNYIIREHLFKRLDLLPEYRLTLIKGTAGSGKTTLMTSFLKEKSFPRVQWISLDGENNNMISFWSYFVEAVKGYLKEEGDISAFFDTAVGNEDVEGLVTLLINQMDGDEPVVLVMDDFHLIQDPQLLESISFFVRHASDNVHLVLLSRENPAFYFSDLLVSGSLLYINEEDLKLTHEEGRRFLKDTLQMGLDDESLEEMNAFSEGWVGGLQLIALASLHGGSRTVKNPKALNKFVVEYLTREIVDALTAPEKEFLIKTSVLGYFDAGVCERFLGSGDWAAMIESLSGKNLFLVQIGEDGDAYRYHNLFCEYLKLQFTKLEPAHKQDLLLKAAEAFKGLGDYEESVRLLFEAGDYRRALEVISLMGQDPKGWVLINQVPLEYIGDNRDLMIQRVFYYYYTADMDSLKRLFESFKDKMEGDPSWKILKIAKSILVDFDMETDNLSLDEMEQVQFSDTTKTIIFIKVGVSLFMRNRFHEALELLDKASRMASAASNPYIQASILTLRSGCKEELGQLFECERIYAETYAIIEKRRLFSFFAMNFYVGITGIFLKRGKLEQAEEHLEKARKNAGGVNLVMDAGYLYNLMELHLLRGEKAKAYELALQLLENDFYKNMLFASGLTRNIFYMGKLDRDLAERFWATYSGYEEKHLRIEDKLTCAIIRYYLGVEEEALALVDEVLQMTRLHKIRVKLVEALLFKMFVLHHRKQQDHREIYNLAREAVYYSYENEIMSPFLVAEDWLVKDLAALREKKTDDLNQRELHFIDGLLARLCSESISGGDLLSSRELEVLGVMSTGATNKEIGEQLCISMATVKTHIINIFSKLHVSNRVEAIDKARERGFLQS